MSPSSDSPRRALLSVSDKKGLIPFAQGLSELGWELLSTGGTAAALMDAGLTVVPVEEYTGFPEMLDGRVKTLHPRVHGGILHRRHREDDLAAIAEHGIKAIDMVVVNLYPFESVSARPGVAPSEVIENIDIGGPSMLRSAAKNHRDVLVVCNPDRYEQVLAALRNNSVTEELRTELAAETFTRTAAYDTAISCWFSREQEEAMPPLLETRFERISTLRYGENPHQAGAFYRRAGAGGPTIGSGELLAGGKELSYNNYLDADAALRLVLDMPAAAAVVIKHCNPCGAASAEDIHAAFKAALDGDPVSAFGGIVALNREVDAELAAAITAKGTFFEVIVAPSFTEEAVTAVRTGPKWGANARLFAVGDIGATVPASVDLRSVSGGLLVQERDDLLVGRDGTSCCTSRAPGEQESKDLDLAWVLSKHVRSNAIVLVKDQALVGLGAGQTSRVGSVKIACEAAGDRSKNAVMGSDAFFPFSDEVEAAAEAGVTAVIQPGGSRRDKEVIATCDERGMAMVLTGMRHFRH